MRFQVDLGGLAPVRDAIRRLGLRSGDTLRPRRSIGEEMLHRTAERMRRGVDPDGNAWKRSRRAERDGGQTLVHTGTLASRNAYDTPGADLQLYSWDKRSRVHQLGLKIEPKHGEYLTIPLRATGGLAEEPSRPVRANKGRDGRLSRHYARGSTFIARRNGKLFIFQHVGEHQVRALYLLVRSAQMVARPYLGFGDDDLAMVLAVFGNWFDTFQGGT
jgi:phage gpG-like protein